MVGGGLGQGAGAVGVEGQEGGAARLGDGVEGGFGGAVADHEGRAGIGDEIVEFGRGVGRVERQEDDPGLEAGGVEREGFGGFGDLRGETVAGFEAGRDERVGEAGGFGEKRAIGDDRAVHQAQEWRVGHGVWREKRVMERVGHRGGLRGVLACRLRFWGIGVGS